MASAKKKGSGTDWPALSTEYAHGTMTLRELAGAHGIREAGVFTRSAADGWEDERKRVRAQTSAAAAVRLHDARVDELAQFNRNDLLVAQSLRKMVGHTIQQWAAQPGSLSPNDMAALARTADTAQKIG